MKIAFYCSNEFPYPCPKEIIYPPLLVAHKLVEGLVARGHEVYLFGSKSSRTKAKLISHNLVSYYEIKNKGPHLLCNGFHDQEMVALYELLMASLMIQEAKKLKADIIHFFSILRKTILLSPFTDIPTLYTMHDSQNAKNSFIFKNCPWLKKINFSSLSLAQKKMVPELNFMANVYNGIDFKKIKFCDKKENYLLWAGRICREKGTHVAIEVAKKTKIPLKIAGPKWDQGYFESFEKEIDSKNIQYLGTLSQKNLWQIMAKAKAFLFPIQWEEPFGMVMAEAMAAGTPVIAFNRGSVPEVIKDKETGFIVKDISEMIEAIKKIDQIDNYKCRHHVENKFSLEKMIEDYERIYMKLVNKKK